MVLYNIHSQAVERFAPVSASTEKLKYMIFIKL